MYKVTVIPHKSIKNRKNPKNATKVIEVKYIILKNS